MFASLLLIKFRVLVKIIFVALLSLTISFLKAQTMDSIYFHLYTDSLKKGTHNYINVDGKQSNGSWVPLTDKEVQFSSSGCKFSGNELIIPADFPGEKITVKAVLKSNPETWIEKTIWIKQKPDPEPPTKEEVMKEFKKGSKRRKN